MQGAKGMTTSEVAIRDQVQKGKKGNVNSNNNGNSKQK
jgi:hypothetical protein